MHSTHIQIIGMCAVRVQEIFKKIIMLKMRARIRPVGHARVRAVCLEINFKNIKICRLIFFEYFKIYITLEVCYTYT